MIINDKNGLLKVNSTMDDLLEELNQTAAGPELEAAKELNNEATVEKEPTELVSDIDNEEVYGDDEEFAEDVGEVVFESYSDEDLYDILEANGYDLTEENLEILREGLEDGTYVLEEEESQLANGPELDGAGELDNEATVEKEPAELTDDSDNKDVYPADEHEQKEDVGEVVVTEAKLSSAANYAAKLQYKQDKNTAVQAAKAAGGTKSEVKTNVANAKIGAKMTRADNSIKKYGKNGIMTGAGASAEAYRQAAENQKTAKLRAQAQAQKDRNKIALKTAKDNAATQRKTNAVDVKTAKNDASTNNKLRKTTARDQARTLKADRAEQKRLLKHNAATKAINAARKTNEKAQAMKEKENATRREERQQARADRRTALNTKIAAGGKGSGFAKFRKAVGLYEELTDLDLLELLQENGYEADLENLMILKEGLETGEYILEAELETEVMPAEAEEKGVVDDKEAERVDNEEDSEEAEKKEDKEDEKEDEEKESTNESAIFNLIRQINESLSQVAAGPELEAAKELDNEATVEKEPAELTDDSDNKDVYPADEHEQKEDVGEVVVKESEQVAAGPELEAAKELDNEATVEKEPAELTDDSDNKDVYPADEHEQKEDVGEVVVKESEQVAAGPELEAAKELDNEATVEKEPQTAAPTTDNKDVYCDMSHKQVEEVVEVVVEAVSICKSKGIPATMDNIIAEAKMLFESDEVALVGKPSEKNYDVDADIESSEKNGSDEKFEDYEDIKGEEADAALTAVVPESALRESVKYNSLKEACMLDEGYFESDSYIKESANEKVQKLTEQVSLLMAREANDPLYDELLKESAYCMRLREQIQNKYKKGACEKVTAITEK